MTTHHQYSLYRDMWTMIKDCIEVEPVKRKGITYLPNPSPDGDIDRYSAYKERAVFYAVTRKTLGGLMGSAFNSQILYDGINDALIANINSQETLDSFVKRCLQNVISYGRALIVPDYVEGKPVLHLYDATEVRDWKVKAGRIIGLTICTVVDDIDVELIHSIVEGSWLVSVNGQTAVMSNEQGENFDYIPCTFIGSTNNYYRVNYPYLYDIAALNIAHYRNSADYEESCFISGQPTLVATGLSRDWIDNVLHGTFQLGSRGGVPLPMGASAEILQVAPQGALLTAMQTKEAQMIALGAKLIEPNSSAPKTATEASNQQGEQINLLALMGRNVEEGIKEALANLRLFDKSLISEGASVKITGDYGRNRFDKDKATTLQALWLNKAITFDELRAGLAGITIHEPDDAQAIIDKATNAEGSQWTTT